MVGKFVNKKGATIEVSFGVGSGELTFSAENAVTISSDVADTFDHIHSNTATISLESESYQGELFTSSEIGIPVEIKRNDVVVFAGYVMPRTFSQDFNSVLDTIEINCNDRLAVLNNMKYKNVGGAVSYADAVSMADIRTFSAILQEMLGADNAIWYDCSKSLSADADAAKLFDNLKIAEALFLSDEEANVWTQAEVLEEMLRFLDLRIKQVGNDYYMFCYDTIRNGGDITWYDIVGGATKTQTANVVAITSAMAEDCNDQITIGETYSRFSATAETQDYDELIVSPLDEDSLISPYPKKQLYCTEYETGNSEQLYYLTRQNSIVYGDDITERHWLVRVMDNPMWRFPYYNGTTDSDKSQIEQFCADGKNQQELPNSLAKTQGAALLDITNVDVSANLTDNSPVNSTSESTCLIISVNGNGDDTESGYYPNETTLKATCPRAVYSGTNAGSLTPSDSRATNYIVFGGKISLVPLQPMTGSWNAMAADTREYGTYYSWGGGDYWSGTWRDQPKRKDDKKTWYTRRYYKAADPFDTAKTDTTTDNGLIFMADDAPQAYKFKYSAVGDSEDHVGKVGVVACMLVIGDKCCVEKFDSDGNSYYEWQTFKDKDSVTEDEYYAQCFTLGFDPAIDDYLVGTEFDMANNISWDMDLGDASGMAISIKSSDNVSGKVQFSILGPANVTWSEVTRRHPTFFRHTKWATNNVPLMSHVANILIKDFTVKVYTDNGHAADEGQDLIYTSDTDANYSNIKDDITFRINSALTTAEAIEIGTSVVPSLSNPTDADGAPLTALYDVASGESAKAEQIYIDAAWREWHEPKVILKSAINYTAYAPFSRYSYPALPDFSMFVQSADIDLSEDAATINFKQI